MGQKTRATIVREGLLAAGDTSLTTRANVWLNTWLRSQYAAFQWPFCMRELPGVALAQGVNKLTLGAGSGGEALEIRRILDPIFIYDPQYSTRSHVRVRSLLHDSLDLDEDVNNPATNKGLPSYAKVRPVAATWGRWDVVLDHYADKAYLLKFAYVIQPADLDETTAGDTAVPIYPADRTMIKAVEVEALRYKKADNYAVEREALASIILDDRMKYGEVPGINDAITLDVKVFR